MGNRSLEVALPSAYIELCHRVKKEHPSYSYLFDQAGLAGSSGFSLSARWELIRKLGLADPEARLTTLDIGAGSGLWSWLLKNHGHRVTSTNPQRARPSWLDSAYLEAHAALGLLCTPLTVRAFVPLQVEPVDLITALKTAFHETWLAAEWEFFLLDVAGCLRPGGRALLQVNRTGHAATSFAALRSLPLPKGWGRRACDVFSCNKEA